MKYIIRQRVISLNDSYVIQDENEKEKYLIKKQIISLFRKYFITDTERSTKADTQKNIYFDA
jgi:uncharacterized protein YxjI